MTNRERWIVYPLLFYALVMGFRATYQDPLEFRCRTIECQQLKVQLINGAPALATSTRFGGPNVIVVEAEPEIVSRTKFPTGTTTAPRSPSRREAETAEPATAPESPAAEPGESSEEDRAVPQEAETDQARPDAVPTEVETAQEAE